MFHRTTLQIGAGRFLAATNGFRVQGDLQPNQLITDGCTYNHPLPFRDVSLAPAATPHDGHRVRRESGGFRTRTCCHKHCSLASTLMGFPCEMLGEGGVESAILNHVQVAHCGLGSPWDSTDLHGSPGFQCQRIWSGLNTMSSPSCLQINSLLIWMCAYRPLALSRHDVLNIPTPGPRVGAFRWGCRFLWGLVGVGLTTPMGFGFGVGLIKPCRTSGHRGGRNDIYPVRNDCIAENLVF